MRPQAAVYGVAITMGVGGVFLARRLLTSRVNQLRTQTVETARQLTPQPESVPVGALDQRFKLRREAVSAMRADLLKLVVAESDFTADSGYPTVTLPQPYSFSMSAGNLPPVIELRPDGWSATIRNLHTAISCTVSVGTESTSTGTASGQPRCQGFSARPTP